MFKRLSNWFFTYQEQQAKERFDRGYKYALHALITGEETPASLQVLADNQFDADEFEKGVLAAIDKLTSGVIIEDDRTL